eukprot:TRINITY_DN9408_c0_g1_i1.p1 TRINITY_DN9408_c0_g1~~TRINITY_DN9408_c0_g1_i1.p1  ORF type:complete len:653 (-),score=102.87 TRINITY_DN9408_c0_g1_i1:470-2428(-)
MTGGSSVRTQMLRAAASMVLFALGTFMYLTAQRTEDSSFLRGTWPVSVAAFQTAILSSELTAPRQERPTTAVIYDASNASNDTVQNLRQEDFADSGHLDDNISALLKAGDVDTKLANLRVGSEAGPEPALKFTSALESKPEPEPESVVSGSDSETGCDIGAGKDERRGGTTSISRLEAAQAGKNSTQDTLFTPAQVNVTVERGSALENIIAASENDGTVAVVLKDTSAEQEITSGAENVSQQDAGDGAAAPLTPTVANLASVRPFWRSEVEEQLKNANLAVEDPSYVSEQRYRLYAPVYLNVTRFKRSYELMEKVFKIYVYKEGEKPLVHAGPRTGIYSSEGQFIERVTKGSNFVTEDPQRAHMFFLPYSVVNMVLSLYVPGSRSMLPLATFIKDYVHELAGKYPFWNMTEGGDHFFVACHDWGPATARDHPTLRSNAVKAVCNADLTEEFVLEKDVSLPEVYLHKPRKGTKVYDMNLGGNGPAHRPYLSFFAGQMHGRVRPVLLQHWKNKDPDMKIYEVLPRAVSKKIPYMTHMKRSKFCICAAGYEVNSPRVVESIYYECVPVIIADNFVLPFSDVLDWSAFSITVPEKDIPNLKQILLGVSDERYRDMQSRLKYVKQHFLWHPDSPEKFDAFHMIMHSVWLRRLKQVNI